MKRKYIEIFHQSRYSSEPRKTIEQIGEDLENDVEKYLKDCEDITFEDTFSVSVDIREVLYLVCQVFHDPREESGDYSLVINLTSGGGFPSFATVFVRKPDPLKGFNGKLHSIERIAQDIQESFEKRDGSAIEDQIKKLLETIN